MSQISRKWIEDHAIDNSKIDNTGSSFVMRDLTITRDLKVDRDATFLNDVDVAGNLRVAQDLTITRDLKVDRDATFLNDVDVAGNLRVAQDLTITRDLKVDRDATFLNDVDVAGNLRVAQDSTFTGHVQLNGTLTQTDSTIIEDLYVGGRVGIGSINPTVALNIVGSAKISSAIRVGGSSVFESDIYVDGRVGIGHTNLNADLDVAGTAIISGTATIGGDVRIDGNVGIGTDSTSTNGITVEQDGVDNWAGVFSGGVTGQGVKISAHGGEALSIYQYDNTDILQAGISVQGGEKTSGIRVLAGNPGGGTECLYLANFDDTTSYFKVDTAGQVVAGTNFQGFGDANYFTGTMTIVRDTSCQRNVGIGGDLVVNGAVGIGTTPSNDFDVYGLPGGEVGLGIQSSSHNDSVLHFKTDPTGGYPGPRVDFYLSPNSGEFVIMSDDGTHNFLQTMLIDLATNHVGIGTSPSMSQQLTVSGRVVVESDSIQISSSRTIADSIDPGDPGEICWDTSYLYVKTGSGMLSPWKRIALTNFGYPPYEISGGTFNSYYAATPTDGTLVVTYTLFPSGNVRLSWPRLTGLTSTSTQVSKTYSIPADLRPTNWNRVIPLYWETPRKAGYTLIEPSGNISFALEDVSSFTVIDPATIWYTI